MVALRAHRRALAVLLLGLYVLGALTGAAHFAAVQHTVCADHGELGHGHVACASAADVGAGEGGPSVDADAGATGGHEHCGWVATVRDDAPCDIDRVELRRDTGPGVLVRAAQHAPRGAPRHFLAPKQSPPV